jgi:hypothetical protein
MTYTAVGVVFSSSFSLTGSASAAAAAAAAGGASSFACSAAGSTPAGETTDSVFSSVVSRATGAGSSDFFGVGVGSAGFGDLTGLDGEEGALEGSSAEKEIGLVALLLLRITQRA